MKNYFFRKDTFFMEGKQIMTVKQGGWIFADERTHRL